MHPPTIVVIAVNGTCESLLDINIKRAGSMTGGWIYVWASQDSRKSCAFLQGRRIASSQLQFVYLVQSLHVNHLYEHNQY